MAFPTYVAAGTVAQATGGASAVGFTPGLPAGIQTGDILILALEIANDGDNVSAPTGYTFVTTAAINSGTSGTRIAYFWRRHTSGDSAPSCTLDAGGDHALARIIAVRGCVATGSPIDATSGGSKAALNTSVTVTGFTTNVNECLIVGAVTNSADGTTNTFSGWTNSNLSNVTERTDNQVSNGDGAGLAIYTGEQAIAGPTGDTTASTSVAGANAFAHFALRPELTTSNPVTEFGTSTTASSQSTSTLTINKPAGGVTTGHLLTAGIVSDATDHVAPSGWVKFGTGENTNYTASLYYKIAGGSEPASYSWTVGSVGPSAGFITAWSNVDLANPIDVISETLSGSSVGATVTTPSATAVTSFGRLFYVRGVRRSGAGGLAVTAVLSESTPAVTVIEQEGATSSSGNTSYSIGQFSDDFNFVYSGSKTGLAITTDQPEDTGYVATYALRAANTGTLATTLPPATITSAANSHNDSTMAMTLSPVTMAFAGTGTPPSGDMAMTLSPVTMAFTGTHFPAGSMDLTLSPVTMSVAGAVNPAGTFEMTLPSLTIDIVSETPPFGAQVIKVEADHRAFRVTDDGDGLIQIKRSQVTAD